MLKASYASGAEAEHETTRGVALETAAAQVAARLSPVGTAEQTLVVEVDRGLCRLVQALLALALGREVRIVVAQRDVRPRREPLHRTHEVELLDLAHECDRVTALLATETKIGPELGVHRERRRLLGVERAQTLEATPDTLERDVLADEGDEIGGLANPLDVFVEDAHCYTAPSLRRPWLRCVRTTRRLWPRHGVHTPLGKSSGRQPSRSTPRPNA